MYQIIANKALFRPMTAMLLLLSTANMSAANLTISEAEHPLENRARSLATQLLMHDRARQACERARGLGHGNAVRRGARLVRGEGCHQQ